MRKFGPCALCLALWQLNDVRGEQVRALLISGGRVVNADQSFLADVLVVGDLIAAVGPHLKAPPGAHVVDAAGLLVMPGGIDPHTHLAMPFMGAVTVDDYLSGHEAALRGGTTHHLDFVLPLEHDLLAGHAAWMEKAQRGCMDYSFHVAVTSWSERVSTDMGTLVERHGVNCASKVLHSRLGASLRLAAQPSSFSWLTRARLW
jgi:dihydropyrimidinase